MRNAPCNVCTFCVWKARGRILHASSPMEARILMETTTVSQHETGKLTTGFRTTGSINHHMNTAVDNSSEHSDGYKRIAKFLRLLQYLGTAPWANQQFAVNNGILRRLTASHLHLIVGTAAFNSDERALYYRMINPRIPLNGAENLVWITNRQQGKTSTLSKFLAALAISSPAGGCLACVYSTSLDRSQELTKAAKQYIYWMIHAGKHADWRDIVMTKDNLTTFRVQSDGRHSINEIIARPKNPDSCRGDAPKVKAVL